MLYCTSLHCTALHCTEQHYFVLCSILPCGTVYPKCSKMYYTLIQCIAVYWAKIIFGGKLRNCSFCHIVSMERPKNVFFEKKAGISFTQDLELAERKNYVCVRKHKKICFSDRHTYFATYRHPIVLLQTPFQMEYKRTLIS